METILWIDYHHYLLINSSFISNVIIRVLTQGLGLCKQTTQRPPTGVGRSISYFPPLVLLGQCVLFLVSFLWNIWEKLTQLGHLLYAYSKMVLILLAPKWPSLMWLLKTDISLYNVALLWFPAIKQRRKPMYIMILLSAYYKFFHFSCYLWCHFQQRETLVF